MYVQLQNKEKELNRRIKEENGISSPDYTQKIKVDLAFSNPRILVFLTLI